MVYLFTTVPHQHGHWQLQELLGYVCIMQYSIPAANCFGSNCYQHQQLPNDTGKPKCFASESFFFVGKKCEANTVNLVRVLTKAHQKDDASVNASMHYLVIICTVHNIWAVARYRTQPQPEAYALAHHHQCFYFQNYKKYFLDTLIQKIYFFKIMKINNFRVT